MIIHDIKCWPVYFEAILEGRKTFEVRLNDRNYKARDMLFIREWDQMMNAYTGRSCHRIVSYIMIGGVFGVQADYVILGLTKELP